MNTYHANTEIQDLLGKKVINHGELYNLAEQSLEVAGINPTGHNVEIWIDNALTEGWVKQAA